MSSWRSPGIAAWTVAALAMTLPATVAAFDLVSSAQIATQCRAYLEDPDSEDGRFCTAFVRGFIDGSPVVVLKTPPETSESFAERAARTRLGRPLAARPEYCIDSSIGIARLIEQIVAVADERPPREDVDAAVLLYGTFARFHKCE